MRVREGCHRAIERVSQSVVKQSGGRGLSKAMQSAERTWQMQFVAFASRNGQTVYSSVQTLTV
jgi:hypothetical protein